MSVGNRLKEVREACGWTQSAMAEAGGVSKRSQIDYEQDKIEMKASYLASIASNGIDVHYVLTGKTAGTAELDEAEAFLITAYRRIDEFARQAVLILFERLAGHPYAVAAQKEVTTVPATKRRAARVAR